MPPWAIVTQDNKFLSFRTAYIFINDLFFLQIKSEICNFAEDNTLYSCDKELGTSISNLKYDMTNILNWFRYNSMKANPDRFQFMIQVATNPSFLK